MTKPQLLLLDVLFSNLDVGSAHGMVDRLMECLSEKSADGIEPMLLLTTHHADLARPLEKTTVTLRLRRLPTTTPWRLCREPRQKFSRTTAARLLDGLGIVYELRAYEVYLDDLTAISVAKKIGLPPEQVFKTLVTKTSENEHLFGVVPGDARSMSLVR